MSGPAASILSRCALDADRVREVRDVIRSVASRVSGDDFWMDDRPFVVVIGPESPDDLDELLDAGLAQVLGWTPRGILTLVAMCDQVADHRLLGALCLRFATQLGGIVSFGGPLSGRGALPRDRPSTPLREDSVEGLAGTLFTLSYPTADHEYATAHLGDVELLRAWLTHPHFHMVK